MLDKIFLFVALVLFVWAAFLALDTIDWGNAEVLVRFGFASLTAAFLVDRLNIQVN